MSRKKSLSVVPNQIFAGDFFEQAIDSFNIYHFVVKIDLVVSGSLTSLFQIWTQEANFV